MMSIWKLMSETLDLAEYDDAYVHNIARLLKVESTDVVLAVSHLPLNGSRSTLHIIFLE